MTCYRVSKVGDGYAIFVEKYDLPSERYQQVKKNSKLFLSYENALNYVLENSSPEARDGIMELLKRERMNKLFENYMKVKDNKEEFEKLFCVKLSDEGFANLRDFMEFIRNEEK